MERRVRPGKDGGCRGAGWKDQGVDACLTCQQKLLIIYPDDDDDVFRSRGNVSVKTVPYKMSATMGMLKISHASSTRNTIV